MINAKSVIDKLGCCIQSTPKCRVSYKNIKEHGSWAAQNDKLAQSSWAGGRLRTTNTASISCLYVANPAPATNLAGPLRTLLQIEDQLGSTYRNG